MDNPLVEYRGYVILSLVEAIVLGALFLWRQPHPMPIEIADPTARPTPTPVTLVVYVSGAVHKPDVYTLAGESRLRDALQAAGGAQPSADMDALNLAQTIYDGQRIHVPAVGEALPAAVAAAAAPLQPQQAGPVNINTAGLAELDALPGIGPALAQRIVDDRLANGPYTEVDQLERVRGIGPTLVEKLRPLVRLH